MLTTQLIYRDSAGWQPADAAAPQSVSHAQLALVFGPRAHLSQAAVLTALRDRVPDARIVLCTTGGTIGAGTTLDLPVATLIGFNEATVSAVVGAVTDVADSDAAGKRLARELPTRGLRHVLVFAEGLQINGTALAGGIGAGLPPGVTVSGGLAGDGEAFGTTLVGLDAVPQSGQVVLVGLYGASLRIGCASVGGWEGFGDDLVITRSAGNVLHELNGRRALDQYREFLGPLGYALPASGLMFPLKVRRDPSSPGVIRTILGVDEKQGTVTFAGDVPEGWSTQLLRTDLDTLIGAAGSAAREAAEGLGGVQAELVLAVSCIGRRLLLQRRTDEELAAVRRGFGNAALLSGFYSYGELAPSSAGRCELHNQTMTITAIGEA